ETDGLYRISGGSVDHSSRNDGLSGRRVSSIYEDREGNLWVSTDGGIDMFRNTPAVSYSTDQGLTASATSVLVSRDGAVWAGAFDGGISDGEKRPDVLKVGGNGRFSPGPPFPGIIGAMFQARSGGLWFGHYPFLAVYSHGRVEKVLDRDG